MIELYHSPSTAAFLPHWLLIDLNVAHTLRSLDLGAREHKKSEYLAINPAGLVPTLVIDGVPICETAAIALHLADAYPDANLAPAPNTLDRARYYQWMFFCANTLQPAYRAWFYPDEPAGAAHVEAAKDQARQVIENAWGRVDSHLAKQGPYLLGAKLCVVDFMLTMLMRWSRNMPKPAHTWPALAAHAALMKQRPSFKEVYAREGLTDWT